MPPDAAATDTSVAAMTSQRAASTRSANRFANGRLATPCLSTELESLIAYDHGKQTVCQASLNTKPDSEVANPRRWTRLR